jgi:hypothetical protein
MRPGGGVPCRALSGFALSHEIKLGRSFAGIALLPTIKYGFVETSAIGSKSLSRS